ncbi:MAG TPA: YkvA family protein [Burkholderiales bacterium]|nr:YkvA family protein [Burkholderiales bacterium]
MRPPTAMPLLSSLKQRARQLKSETLALWLAARHPGTPWYAKLLVAGIAAYALSPIDLIPDFVPILGYLDDLILIPLGIVLAVRMIPPPILEECRARAQEILANGRPVSRVAALVIVGVWLAAAALCALWVYRTWLST